MRAERSKSNNTCNADKLHTAIGEDRQIRFRSYDWDIGKELEPRYNGRWYQLSPWALTWDDEMYYLMIQGGI